MFCPARKALLRLRLTTAIEQSQSQLQLLYFPPSARFESSIYKRYCCESERADFIPSPSCLALSRRVPQTIDHSVNKNIALPSRFTRRECSAHSPAHLELLPTSSKGPDHHRKHFSTAARFFKPCCVSFINLQKSHRNTNNSLGTSGSDLWQTPE